MKNNYVVKKVYRSFILVAILTALTGTLGMLIDNIIVGRFLGTASLGSMGVVGPISLIFSAFSNICSGGGSARISQALGRGEQKQVNNVFTVTLITVFFFGGILTVLGLIFAPQIAVLLGGQGELYEPAVDYLRGFFLGAIPTVLTSTLMAYVRIDGSHRLPLLCISVMTVVNILLDLLMIFVFDMGMFGMALATTIAYCCASLTAMTHFTKDYCTLRLIHPHRIIHEARCLVVTGSPTAISRICDTIKITTLNHLLALCAGAGAIAALNVRTQANNLVGALIMGAGQAIVPIAGLFYGEEDRTSLHDSLKEALKIGLFLCFTAGTVLFFTADSFAALLGVDDPKILSIASMAIRFFAVGMPLQLANLVLMNFYQSTRSTGMASTICILQQLVFTTGFALLLTEHFDASGVWIAFLLSEVCTLITILLLIFFKNKRFPRTLSDMLLLPENFGGENVTRLELSVGNSMKDVISVSRRVYEFGKEQGIEGHLLNSIAICTEELTSNVVKHAFTPGKKQWLDIVIISSKDKLTIRLRDNGALFDPITYLKTHPDAGHLGLLLAKGLSDDIIYRRSVGLNNLLISFNRAKPAPPPCED